MTKKEIERRKESLKDVCLFYSDFKNTSRREKFGISMYERLERNIKFDALYENEIVYKGAQWGGKWGNYYKAIYFRNNEFHFGCGFSNKQILSY